MPERILAAVNDPGGVQALLPVLAALGISHGSALTVLAGPVARPYLSRRNIAFHPVSSSISAEEAFRSIQRHRPRLLLTATSWQASLEQQLRNQAARQEIPSVVLLDFWSNYAQRWQGALYPVTRLADTVCVPDVMAIREMQAVGFPGNRLVATGQPYLEEIFAKAAVQANGGRGSGEFLFLSQPSIIDGKSISRQPHLEMLVAGLRHLARQRNEGLLLRLRLHPKEGETDELRSMVAQLSSQECVLKIVDQRQPVEWDMQNAEVVVGYYTMALFQARALGKRTVSLAAYPVAPGLQNAMLAAGIRSVPLEQDALSDALGDEAMISPPVGFHEGAARAVHAVIAGAISGGSNRSVEESRSVAEA